MRGLPPLCFSELRPHTSCEFPAALENRSSHSPEGHGTSTFSFAQYVRPGVRFIAKMRFAAIPDMRAEKRAGTIPRGFGSMSGWSRGLVSRRRFRPPTKRARWPRPQSRFGARTRDLTRESCKVQGRLHGLALAPGLSPSPGVVRPGGLTGVCCPSLVMLKEY